MSPSRRRPTLADAFGEVLRQVREEAGEISQETLSFEAGTHRTTIGLLERGKIGPSLATLFRLAESLDVRPSEIVRRIEKMRPTVPPPRATKGRSGSR